MGRTAPTVVVPPQSFRRDARSKQAKATVNKTIPALLTSYPRARRGIDAAELIVDPRPPGPDPSSSPSAPLTESKAESKSKARDADGDDGKGKGKANRHRVSEKAPIRIRLRVADTLEAAARLSSTGKSNGKRARVAMLNMASPLRPGGGFLNGASSQEESLCMRTTLYPSLRDEFYRLPEVGAIYTPDVLVFRRWDDEARELDKSERFFVDVVSAGMLRFPDVGDEEGERRFANAKERELVAKKMVAVMRILKAKKLDRVVLGAWGCGAYGNPVGEIARAWRKVLLGAEGKKKSRNGDDTATADGWDGLEVVFAIKDRRMAKEFANLFGPGLHVEKSPDSEQGSVIEDDGSLAAVEEMRAKIVEMESRMGQARNADLKARLGTILAGLKKQLMDMSGGVEASEDGYAGGGDDDGEVDGEDDAGEEPDLDEYELSDEEHQSPTGAHLDDESSDMEYVKVSRKEDW